MGRSDAKALTMETAGTGTARRGRCVGAVLRVFVFAVLVVAAVVLPPSAGAEEGVQDVGVRARWVGETAHIELDWPDRVAAATRLKDRVLVIRFDRPFMGDLGPIRDTLRRYVVLAEIDADRRTLRLALARDLQPSVRRAGRRLAIDLRPPGTEGPLPAVQGLAPRAEPPETTAPPRPTPPPIVAAPAKPVARPPGPEPAAPIPIAPVPVRLEIEREPDVTRLIFLWPEKTGYRLVEDGSVIDLTFARPGTLPLEPFSEDLPAFLTGLEPGPDGPTLGVRLKRLADAGLRHFQDGPRIVVEIARPPGYVDPDGDPDDAPSVVLPEELADIVRAEEAARRAAEAAKAAPETARSDPGPSERPTLIVKAEERGDLIALTVPWRMTVGAAAFRRGDYIWLVFDAPARFDVSALKGRFRDVIVRAEDQPVEGASLLRVGVRRSVLVSAQRDGTAWLFQFGDLIAEPSQPLALNRLVQGPERGELAVPLPGPGRIVRFEDTEVGDRLTAVTLDAAPHGFIAPRMMVDATILPSAHGVAIDPTTEDLTVELRDGAVRISRPGGLIMSGPDTRQKQGLRAAVDLGPGYMNFAEWSGGGTDRFGGNLHRYQAAVRAAADDPAAVGAARLALARFYASHDFMIEALGILDLIEADTPEAVNDSDVRALRGVARLRAGRARDALEDLSHPSLRFDPSAALWRSVAHAELEEWKEARHAFDEGRPALVSHNEDQQAHFFLALAEASLGVNDLGGAQEALARLERDPAGDPVAVEAALVDGALKEALGVPDKARAVYSDLMDRGPPPARARATFRHLMLERRLDHLDSAATIEGLERLRFQWRGDDQELEILHQLGKLYVESGSVRQGLNIMRLAVKNFPAAERTRDLTDDMAEVFAALFLEGKADDMTPVQALALFYDFKELVPVGTRGDDMIRRLADRLVAVDLLEQAAELLDYQVRFRLRGVARSQVATKLALVHLMDRKPDKALQIIHATRQTRLPERLNRQRRLLEARALSDLGRHEQGLEVIEEYNTLEAQALRADILWQSQDWPKAADALETLATRMTRDGTVDEGDRLQIMRAAIAFALGDDADGLARLRQRFTPLMSGTPDEQAFAIVTQRIETQGVAFRELVGRIAATDTLDAFMDGFSEGGGSEPAG